jgi:hypothetical protein
VLGINKMKNIMQIIIFIAALLLVPKLAASGPTDTLLIMKYYTKDQYQQFIVVKDTCYLYVSKLLNANLIINRNNNSFMFFSAKGDTILPHWDFLAKDKIDKNGIKTIINLLQDTTLPTINTCDNLKLNPESNQFEFKAINRSFLCSSCMSCLSQVPMKLRNKIKLICNQANYLEGIFTN